LDIIKAAKSALDQQDKNRKATMFLRDRSFDSMDAIDEFHGWITALDSTTRTTLIEENDSVYDSAITSFEDAVHRKILPLATEWALLFTTVANIRADHPEGEGDGIVPTAGVAGTLPTFKFDHSSEAGRRVLSELSTISKMHNFLQGDDSRGQVVRRCVAAARAMLEWLTE
jgi:hypothetical protein